MTRLIIRADDAASCSEANRAIAACVAAGTVRCVSVMAIGGELAEAAALLAGCDEIEIGLHVSLNAEWERVPWRPILSAERVPSLVDGDGYLLPLPEDLKRRGFSVDEAMAEVAAQLERLRAVGFHPTYLDEHCRVGWISDGLSAALDRFAVQEGLLRVPQISALPGRGALAARIAGANIGDYLLVTHPGKNEPGGLQSQFHLRDAPNDGSVARERDAESQALCDPHLRTTLRLAGVTLVTYSEMLRQQ